MNIDIIKSKIIVLRNLNTPNSEFTVSLFEHYLKVQNSKKYNKTIVLRLSDYNDYVAFATDYNVYY